MKSLKLCGYNTKKCEEVYEYFWQGLHNKGNPKLKAPDIQTAVLSFPRGVCTYAFLIPFS